MITKEKFINIIDSIEIFDKELDNWYDVGIDIIESPLIESVWKVFQETLSIFFTEAGIDWIYWYLFENHSINTNEPLPCYDENNKRFYVRNSEDLWNLVQEYKI